jgi:SH3-like domain-containing protein
MKKLFSIALFLILICSIFTQASAADKTFPYLGKVSAQDVNIRSGPHINFEILGKLKKDRTVVVVGKKDAWLKIKLPKSFSLFVSSKFVQVEPNATSGIITSNRVNVRARPDPNSTVIVQLNKGDIIHIRTVSNNWFKIMPPIDSFALINESFIQYVEPFVEQNIKPSVKKAQPKPVDVSKQVRKSEDSIPLAEGVVMDSGRLFSKKPLHKLVDDKGMTIYYLEADKKLLDSFSNAHVAIWGDISNDKGFDAPVIRVQKIHTLE